MLPDKTPIFSYNHTLRSRYSETDKMGYVYYGHYLAYFEAARTEMIRSIGYPYRKLEDNGFMLPVVDARVKYEAPLLYDDLVTVNVCLYEMPSVKLETWYQIHTREQKKRHATGYVTLCFVDENSRKPCKAPRGFIKKLNQISNTK